MNKSFNNFGEFILNKRMKQNLTLREFCRKFGYEPSYISRVENSIINAPSEKEKLIALAKALEIKEHSEDWITFFSLASSSRVIVPKDIKDNFPNVVNFLPAFFRTSKKKVVTQSDIKDLLKLIHNDSTDRE